MVIQNVSYIVSIFIVGNDLSLDYPDLKYDYYP